MVSEGCAGGPQGGQQDVAFGRKGPAGNEEENGSGSGCVARGELGQSGGFAHLEATWEKESPRQSGKGSGEFMLQRG